MTGRSRDSLTGTDELIVSRYLAGELIRVIALDIGRSEATVSRHLRRAGVLLRGRGTGQRSPTRDEDHRQARQRVQSAARAGRLPRPRDLPCTDCGHIWQAGGPWHDYDHYLGYAAEHQLDVECVCRPCHLQRMTARGERPHGDSHPARKTPERLARGEQHGQAKLTIAQVATIHAQLASGQSMAHIASDFGVSPSTVWRIAHGNTWRSA